MVTVGAIGYGYWGPNLVRVLDSMPDVNMKVVCDADADSRNKAEARHPGIATTPDAGDILGDDTIDAVIITLPAPLHAEYAIKAIEAGKHVFVEKPLTLSVADAARVAEAAEKTDLVAMVGHLLVYHPAVKMLKELINTGELGDIHYIYTQRLNLGVVRKCENAFWSLAPHDISVLLYLLEETPRSVSAVGESYIQEGIEDTVFAHLKFGGRKMAHVHVSWLDPHRVRRITVVGEKKMAVFDDVEQSEKVKIFDKGVERPSYTSYGETFTLRFGDIRIPRLDSAEPLKVECRHFIDCVKNGTKPLSGPREGLAVVSVLEAAQESLAGKGVEILTNS